MQIGRRELFTDAKEITYNNIIPILQNAFPLHQTNAMRMNFLLDYEAGNQPLQRVKTYRKDIDCKCVDNVAHEIAKFHIGYKWGVPITIVQRGEKDSGNENEVKSLSLLNEQYEIQHIRKKTQRLARFVEICGVGYTFVDINSDYEDGESLFNIEATDPRTTFVIRSSYYYDKRVMIGVTFRTDEKGNHYFTCFTKDARFEILNLCKILNGRKVEQKETWEHAEQSGDINPLGIIPIIEWIRSDDRMGCFERQISDMDNLNLLISDFTNDVDQNTQAIWHCNDVDFPKETVILEDGTKEEVLKKPTTNDWMQTFTTQDGKTPFVKPLAVEYDYSGMLNNILSRRQIILQNADVPCRNDNSGGSTGIAMSDATGWSNAETIAAAQQNIMEGCKMEEIKVVLRAIKASSHTPADSPLLELKYRDCQPNIKRNKNYELANKTNAWATLVSHGMNGYHALKTVNLVDDVNQVWADSKDLIIKYQESLFNKGGNEEGRLQGDYSDQNENSPSLK
ncbi:MAG: phage portal protein [Bacteroidaceae bacterium]|nr:phage portal protein [Bacteroidaceae bacterium]